MTIFYSTLYIALVKTALVLALYKQALTRRSS